MSRYRESSEITALCRAAPGGARRVSRHLRTALVACDRALRVTEGRFDPRIVDDLEALGFAAVSQRADGVQVGRRFPRRRILDRCDDGTVALPEPVDLGGIGKGLALRWAADAVEQSVAAATDEHSATRGFLIDAGGDVVVRGRSGPDEPWFVGIEDPAGAPSPIAVVRLAGAEAIATSSTRIHRRTLADGRLVHHLVDPRTHEPAESGLLAVTVAGSDPAWAEVWSKALFVEGRRGIAELARRRGLAAWWAADDGAFEMTAAARTRTAWVAAES
jgi:thiamine biosynthesis lipoprotein